MTTHVVADGITAKRKPTMDEMEILLVNRIPDLIRRYKEGGLDPVGVNATLQMVAEGTIITEQKTVAVTPPKPKPEKLELLTTFEVTVPADYNHATQLDSFRAAHQSETKKEFYHYNPNLTDANFTKTPALIPGKKFLVKAFQIKGSVTSDDCLAQLRRVKATLTGAQGVSLAYEQAKDKLPISRWSLSFDEKDNLPFVGGCHGVPDVHRHSDGDFEFDLGDFEIDWHDDCVLLAFCDLPAGEA